MVNEEPSIYTHITATEEEAQQRRQRQKHAQEENNEVTLTEEKITDLTKRDERDY